ncbi:hypothetical protein G3N59_13635 [Paraburkholderia sp. Ac-20340]|uniref:hypothetical protein n=1 Tax=Paraburkholderia sp. Ac-20340 TaxID=2703888 RepID=UPI001980DAAC|nr:hypothetical protein [Paraburkholderia sp. Ac-20340]MBN3854423.1 hypothetical protein [Paraburkholderia sp. Ac-20340]
MLVDPVPEVQQRADGHFFHIVVELCTKRAQLPASPGFIVRSGTIAKKLWHNRRSFPRHPPYLATSNRYQMADASTERMPPELNLSAQDSRLRSFTHPGADNP